MPDRPDFAAYAVKHPDGRWLYHVPAADSWGVTAILAEHDDATPTAHPMTRIGEKSPWWSTDREATRITLLKKRGNLTVGYKLTDPDTASVRYPPELTVDEWNTRTAEAERLWDLYDSVTVPQDVIEEHIDGPFVVLEGAEPPAGNSPTWTVNLLDGITQRPEYRHLFPGRLTGLRKHVITLIKRMPRVTSCFDGFQESTAVYVALRLPYEQTETTFVRKVNGRGQTLKSGRHVERTVDRTLHLPISDTVAGPNHAAALAEWDRQVAFWTQAVTDSSVAACNHCRGTGYVPSGSEQYTHTK